MDILQLKLLEHVHHNLPFVPPLYNDLSFDNIQEYNASGELDSKVACIITDIEMPQMDGHRLTKLVKENGDMNHIPVVIFSSLVNQEMKIKGEQLGADAQLSKPEIGQLVAAIDKLVGNE